jgi:hypothetical protein
MPCSDSRCQDDYYSNYQQEQSKNTVLEAMLCALLTEITNDPNIDQSILIENAEANGQIAISPFWYKHRQEDDRRIKKMVDKLSAHELEVLKKLL